MNYFSQRTPIPPPPDQKIFQTIVPPPFPRPPPKKKKAETKTCISVLNIVKQQILITIEDA